jgi:hypothetical protein
MKTPMVDNLVQLSLSLESVIRKEINMITVSIFFTPYILHAANELLHTATLPNLTLQLISKAIILPTIK